uniref:Uncharacterized protein n=1 Tax=Anguilla anguilla TaxID=7936 RepID=A0A0E9XRI6_ANGAN
MHMKLEERSRYSRNKKSRLQKKIPPPHPREAWQVDILYPDDNSYEMPLRSVSVS